MGATIPVSAGEAHQQAEALLRVLNRPGRDIRSVVVLDAAISTLAAATDPPPLPPDLASARDRVLHVVAREQGRGDGPDLPRRVADALHAHELIAGAPDGQDRL